MYRRIANDKSAGSTQNRHRQFTNFHKIKILQSNQSQDVGEMSNFISNGLK